MDDLFPHTRPDALNITRNLFNAVATNYSLLVPSPTAGFTLFASADTAYTSRQSELLSSLCIAACTERSGWSRLPAGLAAPPVSASVIVSRSHRKRACS